jgi:hypothetical protein
MQITFICVRCATVYSVVNWLALVMKLENQDGIEKLYFELASESRFAILRELNRKKWQDERNRRPTKLNHY